MTMRSRVLAPSLLALSALASGPGCDQPPTAPDQPTWADVAPILRGSCNSCHGWTSPRTGSFYRFDFYDVTKANCGDAALAMDPNVTLAGSTASAMQIAADVIPQSGAAFPTMPPQPSPAVPDWEILTLTRWAAHPIKGPPPAGNAPPTITVSNFPLTAGNQLGFTAVLSDPNGDSAIGVIEVNNQAFLMDRPGSFDVSFDSSTWTAGSMRVQAVLCDGWTSGTYDLGPVTIQH